MAEEQSISLCFLGHMVPVATIRHNSRCTGRHAHEWVWLGSNGMLLTKHPQAAHAQSFGYHQAGHSQDARVASKGCEVIL